MKALEKPQTSTFFQKLIGYSIIITSVIIIAGTVYYGIGWMKTFFENNTITLLGFRLKAIHIISFGVAFIYVGLLYYSSKFPPLEMDDPNSRIVKLPETGPTVKTGFKEVIGSWKIMAILLPRIVLISSRGISRTF